uniref:Glutaredoxin domain-containing protein n=1 Tax=Physcomitrium patens TaxID=3218 RepID=A0A7I4BG11_PHYPA
MCRYCKRAKSVFESMSVKPFVLELDEREDGDDIQQALGKFVGRRTVPQVFINGVHLGGSDDTVAAQQSGRLKKLLAGSASAVNAENLKSEL